MLAKFNIQSPYTFTHIPTKDSSDSDKEIEVVNQRGSSTPLNATIFNSTNLTYIRTSYHAKYSMQIHTNA